MAKKISAAVLLGLALLLTGCDTVLQGGAKDSAGGDSAVSLTTGDISEYEGLVFTTVNENDPYFSDEDLTTQVFENYSGQDSLGRCGVAYANVCEELMPTGERGEIGQIRPSGWKTAKYTDIVEGNYLYNRCHLIAYMLAGENANEDNLITGTRWFNVQGMLPFETAVHDYVKDTGNHVLYRVTPVYDGNNLVASGVEMEALSVEDDAVCFNVFIYNVQPGIEIDYATGESSLDDGYEAEIEAAKETQQELEDEVDEVVGGELQNVEVTPEAGLDSGEAADEPSSVSETYILNTNTKKFHLESCASVSHISEKNRQEYSGRRSELIDMGYEPCGECKP